MFAVLACYAFAVGAIIGSFLNVVIHRYPREESVVFPPSHCPHCDAKINPYDNIPIVSFLVLGGRCRNCRGSISLRYPLIELANGLFYLAIYQRTGVSLAFLPLAAIVSMTIVLIYIDLDIQILPDVIDLPGAAIGVGMAAGGIGPLLPDLTLAQSFIDSLAGAALGSGLLLAIALGYKLLRKVDGMGLGDVKMMAMIGALLGWEPLLAVLLIASVTGAIFGVSLALGTGRGMQVPIPFGVFLGIGTLAVLFFGHTLLETWMRLMVGA
jgi:leader peptidase (prepilin peptidase)/N-methyltransferase